MSDAMRHGRPDGADDLHVGEHPSPDATEEVVERMRDHLRHADDDLSAMADTPTRPNAPVRPDVGDEDTPPSTTQLAHGEQAAAIGVDSPKGAVQAAGEKIGETAGQARQAAARATEQARDAATQAAEQARDVANQAADRLNDQADQALNAAGDGLSAAAQQLRQQAPQGAAGEFAERAADTLERGSTYLRDSDLSSIYADVAMAVRRNPLPWVLGAVGLGYLMSRRRRSRW